jgi:hypothetical protein
MNVADSMKNVLKHKSHLLTEHLKEDITLIMKEVSDDMSRMLEASKTSVKHLKKQKIKITFQEVKDAASDGLVILKILPHRISEGFHYFKEDLISELDSFPDQKEKTLFSIKVIGALTSFTLGTVYNVKKGNLNFSINGLKKVNTFTQFVFAEIVFKITRLLLLRFLNEVEKGVSESEDVSNITYFKELLSNKSDEDHAESGDPAIEIVENLKKYIMTGKRGIE